jgi:hypothetical protein
MGGGRRRSDLFFVCGGGVVGRCLCGLSGASLVYTGRCYCYCSGRGRESGARCRWLEGLVLGGSYHVPAIMPSRLWDDCEMCLC